jgi:hypothetical protein
MYNKKNNYNNPYKKDFKKRDYATSKKKEDLTEIINRRNQRIKDFFNLCGISIRLLGNKNAPAMVVEDKYVLNCYVHNFELRFTDNPMQGNLIYTVKLTEKPNFDKNKVLSCISDYEKRVLTKIQLKNTKPILYLSGYNFLDKENKEGKYPVFSSYVPKIYFSEEKAKGVIEELSKDGYDLDQV